MGSVSVASQLDGRVFKDALDMPVTLLGGINTLETINSAVNEGLHSWL